MIEIWLVLTYQRYPIDYSSEGDRFFTTGYDPLDYNKRLYDINNELGDTYLNYYELESHGEHVWFNKEKLRKDLPHLLELADEMVKILNEINDGTLEIQDELSYWLKKDAEDNEPTMTMEEQRKEIKSIFQSLVPEEMVDLDVVNNFSEADIKTQKERNINYLKIISLVPTNNKYQYCEIPPVKAPIKIDRFVNYDETRNYFDYPDNCLCFYKNDNIIDGKKGLYNAIYHNDKDLLKKYYDRFRGIKKCISPDYSFIGNMPWVRNVDNIWKSRFVSSWLRLVCKIDVIPNISFSDPASLDYVLPGIENSEVVAINTVGWMKSQKSRNNLKEIVKRVVDDLIKLKQILVYTSCSLYNHISEVFEYAYKKGVEITVPSNTLYERNQKLSYERWKKAKDNNIELDNEQLELELEY